MSLTVVKNATCTFCGCVCDDIELHAEGDKIVKTKNACSLGESWFRNHTAERLYPNALIAGQPATVDEAVRPYPVSRPAAIAGLMTTVCTRPCTLAGTDRSQLKASRLYSGI